METGQKNGLLAASLLAVVSTTLALLGFLETNEGFGPYHIENGQRVYTAYPDPGYGTKLPTICNGHTRGVTMQTTATLEQCRAWLSEDVQWAKERVGKCLTHTITQKQFDALTSFEFNTGLFCFTQMKTYINNGQCYLAANEFNNSPQIDRKTGKPRVLNGKVVMKSTTSNGIPLRGLERRRKEEREMFEDDCAKWEVK